MVILKYLEKPEMPVKGAVMVAAWDWLLEEVREFHHTFFETGFDYVAIKRKGVPLVIVNSTNDPWIDFKRSTLLAPKIGAQFISIPNAGHFMEKNGYKEFPQLVEVIERIRC